MKTAKKRAPTAATVQGTIVNHHVQNTTNSGKAQGIAELEYPFDTEKTIALLESEFGIKMSSQLKDVWKLLTTVENEVYERGRSGKAYHSDWVKDWKVYFGSEPDSKMKLLLEKVDRLMTNSYEKGKQAVVAEKRIAYSGRI